MAEENEIAALKAEKAGSYENIFLSMDAVDLSYYSSLKEYDLVQEAAISLRHEKFILHYLDNPIEYLKHFAIYTWDDEADAAAEEFIQWYVERFRPELERQRDIDWSGGVERDLEDWIRDLANDERESVIVYDLDAGETLLVRYGDEDSVSLQEELRELVKGRNIALIHNHPNSTPASFADLNAADWLDAEYMIVVNPDGRQHHYERRGGALAALAPIHNPGYVVEADRLESLAADVANWIQTWRELGNPPEMVMRQQPRKQI